jgi:hypothetical protein
MTRKVLIGGESNRLLHQIVLGAGLEPASLSAYAPQTYVSASSTTRASRGENFPQTTTTGKCRFRFRLLMLVLIIEGPKQIQLLTE